MGETIETGSDPEKKEDLQQTLKKEFALSYHIEDIDTDGSDDFEQMHISLRDSIIEHYEQALFNIPKDIEEELDTIFRDIESSTEEKSSEEIKTEAFAKKANTLLLGSADGETKGFGLDVITARRYLQRYVQKKDPAKNEKIFDLEKFSNTVGKKISESIITVLFNEGKQHSDVERIMLHQGSVIMKMRGEKRVRSFSLLRNPEEETFIKNNTQIINRELENELVVNTLLIGGGLISVGLLWDGLVNGAQHAAGKAGGYRIGKISVELANGERVFIPSGTHKSFPNKKAVTKFILNKLKEKSYKLVANKQGKVEIKEFKNPKISLKEMGRRIKAMQWSKKIGKEFGITKEEFKELKATTAESLQKYGDATRFRNLPTIFSNFPQRSIHILLYPMFFEQIREDHNDLASYITDMQNAYLFIKISGGTQKFIGSIEQFKNWEIRSDENAKIRRDFANMHGHSMLNKLENWSGPFGKIPTKILLTIVSVIAGGAGTHKIDTWLKENGIDDRFFANLTPEKEDFFTKIFALDPTINDNKWLTTNILDGGVFYDIADILDINIGATWDGERGGTKGLAFFESGITGLGESQMSFMKRGIRDVAYWNLEIDELGEYYITAVDSLLKSGLTAEPLKKEVEKIFGEKGNDRIGNIIKEKLKSFVTAQSTNFSSMKGDTEEEEIILSQTQLYILGALEDWKVDNNYIDELEQHAIIQKESKLHFIKEMNIEKMKAATPQVEKRVMNIVVNQVASLVKPGAIKKDLSSRKYGSGIDTQARQKNYFWIKGKE